VTLDDLDTSTDTKQTPLCTVHRTNRNQTLDNRQRLQYITLPDAQTVTDQ